MPYSARSIISDAIVTDVKLRSHSAIDRYYALWQTIHPRLPWQENGTGSTIDQMLEPFQRSPPFGSWTNRMIQFVDDKHFPRYS